MNKGCRLAIVGATGEVGRALLSRLEDMALVLAELHVLATAASAEETLMYRQRPLLVEDADDFDFSRADIVLLATPAAVSRVLAPRALEAGCRVIDHSVAYHGAAGVPFTHEPAATGAELVAAPSAPAALLRPLLVAAAAAGPLRAVHVGLLSPVSAAGRPGVRELAGQTGELLNGRGIEPSVFPVQTAFNVLPLVGSPAEEAEAALRLELGDVLGEDVALMLQSVTVPVFYGLTALLTICPDDAENVPAMLAAVAACAPEANDNSEEDQQVATPVTDAAGQAGVYLSGLRAVSAPGVGISLAAVADNLHQGAAVHSLELVKKWIKDFKY